MACNGQKELNQITNSVPMKKATDIVVTVHDEGNEAPDEVQKDLLEEFKKWNLFKKRHFDSLKRKKK